MRLYGNTPTKYAATIHYGDSSVTDADFGYIPQISKMAREWNNGYFQKLANSIINRETPAQDLNEWPSYLFYEPTLEESPWAGLPLSHYWENGEAFVARSSWKDDAKDFVLYFRCGPPAGHKNFEEGWSSVNHAHPDCNSFTIADKGEYLATEDGHKFEGKIRLTKNHNTILVDGRGQLGDGTTGDLPDNTDTNKLHINAIDPGSFAFVEGVGYTAYPSGLFSKFDRNILYLRKGTVIIIDELASKEARDYDWLFQGDKDHRIVYEGMGVSRVIGINGAEQELKINFVGSDGLEFIMGDTGWWYFASTTASPGYKVDKLIVSPVSKKSEHTFFSVLESIGGGNIEKNIEKIEKEKLRGVKIVSSEGQDLVLFHNGESTYGDLGTDGVISYRRLLSGKVSSAFCSECTNLSANEKTLISANTKIIAIGT